MIKYLEKNENLEDLIKEGNYLIDFYADWCGPCKMLTMILEDLEDVNIIKVNADNFIDLASKYGVMSLPTLLFAKDGEIKNTEVGFRSKEEIESIMSSL